MRTASTSCCPSQARLGGSSSSEAVSRRRMSPERVPAPTPPEQAQSPAPPEQPVVTPQPEQPGVPLRRVRKHHVVWAVLLVLILGLAVTVAYLLLKPETTYK